MALKDYDGDGRNDLFDDYCEYRMYQDMKNSNPEGAGCASVLWFLVMMITMAILFIFFS